MTLQTARRFAKNAHLSLEAAWVRRWQEAAGRREREREQLAAEKKAASIAAVAAERNAQAASKLIAQAELAKAEAADFKRTIRRVREEQAALKSKVVATTCADAISLTNRLHWTSWKRCISSMAQQRSFGTKAFARHKSFRTPQSW